MSASPSPTPRERNCSRGRWAEDASSVHAPQLTPVSTHDAIRRGRPPNSSQAGQTMKFWLPIELDGACIVRLSEREVFSAYVPSPRGPVFMALIEKTFGKEVTTRTWETIAKVAK